MTLEDNPTDGNVAFHLRALTELACRWRRATERTDRSEYPCLEAFPHGSCDDASLLLAEFLREQSVAYDDTVRVAGEFESDGDFAGSHAWLEWRGIVIDITTDQFDHGPRVSVFVAAASSWHAAFCSVEREPARIARYDARTREMLDRVYKAIRQQL